MVLADLGQRTMLATTASTSTTPAMPRIRGSLLLLRRISELPGRGVPLVAILGHGTADDGVETRGQPSAVRRRTGRFGVEVVVHQRRHVSGERRVAGGHL